MSRLTGNKRKQASVDAAGTASSSSSSGNHAFASVVEGEDLYKLDIENTIAKAIDDVKNGSFSELQKRSLALDRMKEKQIAAADRHRKQQILNINQMFEYEVEDAKAIYNKAYQELQEQLFSELNDEKQRLIAIQRQLQNENDESKPNNNSRSLRSTVPISSDMDGAQKAGTRGRKRGTKAEPVPMSLNEAISEDSRRLDLLEIVRDLKARTSALNSLPDVQITVYINEEMSEIHVNEAVLEIGDTVMIKSKLTDEEFVGILTAISTREVVLRTGSGPRISFQISQIQGSRISISKIDAESI